MLQINSEHLLIYLLYQFHNTFWATSPDKEVKTKVTNPFLSEMCSSKKDVPPNIIYLSVTLVLVYCKRVDKLLPLQEKCDYR